MRCGQAHAHQTTAQGHHEINLTVVSQNALPGFKHPRVEEVFNAAYGSIVQIFQNDDGFQMVKNHRKTCPSKYLTGIVPKNEYHEVEQRALFCSLLTIIHNCILHFQYQGNKTCISQANLLRHLALFTA
ncbi:hypothetical protein C789_2977 [Microcystis aeruginosa FACHB-905 = DIANCHI905]|nr:hypothetical protein C789_2977 [Microcystis aeruginosa FACHB-905 = DIANCHI905]